jgi:hypothetical protein
MKTLEIVCVGFVVLFFVVYAIHLPWHERHPADFVVAGFILAIVLVVLLAVLGLQTVVLILTMLAGTIVAVGVIYLNLTKDRSNRSGGPFN